MMRNDVPWGELNAGGGGEGGFMDESYNDAAGATQAEGQQKKQENKAILPIMIGHLLQFTPQSIHTYGSTAVGVLRIIAVVKDIKENSTKLAFDLEDETGTIKAFRWLEVDTGKSNVPDGVEINKYVVLHGQLRETGEDERHLVILHARKPKNYAEILAHLMEVTLAARTKNDEGVVSRQPTNNTATFSAYSSNELNPDQEYVLKVIKEQDDDDAGMERSVLKSRLPAHLVPKLDTVLQFLAGEGHIYTTSTDDHFKAT